MLIIKIKDSIYNHPSTLNKSEGSLQKEQMKTSIYNNNVQLSFSKDSFCIYWNACDQQYWLCEYKNKKMGKEFIPIDWSIIDKLKWWNILWLYNEDDAA